MNDKLSKYMAAQPRTRFLYVGEHWGTYYSGVMNGKEVAEMLATIPAYDGTLTRYTQNEEGAADYYYWDDNRIMIEDEPLATLLIPAPTIATVYEDNGGNVHLHAVNHLGEEVVYSVYDANPTGLLDDLHSLMQGHNPLKDWDTDNACPPHDLPALLESLANPQNADLIARITDDGELWVHPDRMGAAGRLCFFGNAQFDLYDPHRIIVDKEPEGYRWTIVYNCGEDAYDYEHTNLRTLLQDALDILTDDENQPW